MRLAQFMIHPLSPPKAVWLPTFLLMYFLAKVTGEMKYRHGDLGLYRAALRQEQNPRVVLAKGKSPFASLSSDEYGERHDQGSDQQ